MRFHNINGQALKDLLYPDDQKDDRHKEKKDSYENMSKGSKHQEIMNVTVINLWNLHEIENEEEIPEED